MFHKIIFFKGLWLGGERLYTPPGPLFLEGGAIRKHTSCLEGGYN